MATLQLVSIMLWLCSAYVLTVAIAHCVCI